MSDARLFMPVDMDRAATFTSEPVDLVGRSGLFVHIQYGAITGTIAFQVRGASSMDWESAGDITSFPTITAPAGSAGHQLINLSDFRAPFLRVVYTHASGVGELKIAVYGSN